ncbi:hypothetical protein HK101_011060, partial [Irineochytrium annulatum]
SNNTATPPPSGPSSTVFVYIFLAVIALGATLSFIWCFKTVYANPTHPDQRGDRRRRRLERAMSHLGLSSDRHTGGGSGFRGATGGSVGGDDYIETLGGMKDGFVVSGIKDDRVGLFSGLFNSLKRDTIEKKKHGASTSRTTSGGRPSSAGRRSTIGAGAGSGDTLGSSTGVAMGVRCLSEGSAITLPRVSGAFSPSGDRIVSYPTLTNPPPRSASIDEVRSVVSAGAMCNSVGDWLPTGVGARHSALRIDMSGVYRRSFYMNDYQTVAAAPVGSTDVQQAYVGNAGNGGGGSNVAVQVSSGGGVPAFDGSRYYDMSYPYSQNTHPHPIPPMASGHYEHVAGHYDQMASHYEQLVLQHHHQQQQLQTRSFYGGITEEDGRKELEVVNVNVRADSWGTHRFE